jgi:hypothetical protein
MRETQGQHLVPERINIATESGKIVIDFTKRGYTAFALQALRSITPNHNIRPGVNALMHGLAEVKAHNFFEADSRDHKIEISEIAAFCIEEVWALINHIKNDRKKIVLSLPEQTPEGLYVAKPVSHKELVGKLEKVSSLDEAVALVIEHTREFVYRCVLVWIDDREKMLSNLHKNKKLEQQEIQSARAYSRLKDLLKRGEHNIVAVSGQKMGRPVEGVNNYIFGGFNGAYIAVHGIHSIVPDVYRTTTGNTITAEKFAAITKRARSLAIALANVFIRYNDIFEKQLQMPRGENLVTPFDANKFTIFDGESLEIKPTVLIKIFEEISEASKKYSDVLSVGCPALYAPGQNNATVIPEFYDWQHSLILKYVSPLLSKLLLSKI